MVHLPQLFADAFLWRMDAKVPNSNLAGVGLRILACKSESAELLTIPLRLNDVIDPTTDFAHAQLSPYTTNCLIFDPQPVVPPKNGFETILFHKFRLKTSLTKHRLNKTLFHMQLIHILIYSHDESLTYYCY